MSGSIFQRGRDALQRLLKRTPPPKPAEPVPPVSAQLSYTLRSAALTDIGRVRAANQDTLITGERVFGVADGMGGHQGGETASREAADTLLAALKELIPAEDALAEAITHTNTAVYTHAQAEEALSGMGTTLTVLWLGTKEAVIGHVGDSRCYLLRDGALRQVTTDHSFVGELVRSGLLTQEEAATHPMRNVITRAIGTDEAVQPEVLTLPRQTGDRWLICSDGLHGMVTGEEITRTLLEEPDTDAAAAKLLSLALNHGGRDNVSVVLVDDGEVCCHE